MYVQDLMILNMMIVGFTLFYHILLYVHLEFFPNWLNHCFKCRKKTTRRRRADAAPRLPPTTKGQMHPRRGPSTSKPWNQWFTKKNMKKQRFSSTSSKVMDLDNFWLWFRCWCTQIHGDFCCTLQHSTRHPLRRGQLCWRVRSEISSSHGDFDRFWSRKHGVKLGRVASVNGGF